jgi:PAP2 superfamily
MRPAFLIALARVPLTALLAALSVNGVWAWGQPGIVEAWNNAALAEVRLNKFGPPVVARALAITHTCIYDAWAAYDATAMPVASAVPRRPAAENNDANKAKALSFAAYRCLLNLFPTATPRLNAVMTAWGYNPADTSTDVTLPQGIGNVAAAAVIASRRNDGSNQYGDLAAGTYTDYTGFVPANGPMPFCLPTTPGTCPLNVTDPYHWQPLINNTGATQTFVAPHWERVTPFALTSASQYDDLASVAAGPNYLKGSTQLQSDINQTVSYSGALTPQQKLIVEYWADGPASELPPGHWGLLAQYVALRDGNTIDRSVKMFFAMHNASFDAGIVAWHLKRKLNGVRPITAVRYFLRGTGIVAWGGPNQPIQTIDGGKWTPYNPGSNLTPSFPGWISGHSTFSAASAAVLRSFTGSDNFGYSTTLPANFGRVEAGIPAVPTSMSYATFTAAANEAGMSRLYGGIHFADDNAIGQDLGTRVGNRAMAKAQFLFEGGLRGVNTSLASSPAAWGLTWSHTVDALNNRLLVVGVTMDNVNNTAQSVTYNGVALSRLGAQNTGALNGRAELWYLLAPPVGTANVVVSMSQFNDIVAGATTYSGVNQASPWGTFRAAAARSGQACLTTANEPAPLVTTVLAVKGDAGGTYVGTGQVMRWLGVSNATGNLNDPHGAGEIIGKGATYTAGPVTSACSPLQFVADWAMVGVPLRPAF